MTANAGDEASKEDSSFPPSRAVNRCGHSYRNLYGEGSSKTKTAFAWPSHATLGYLDKFEARVPQRHLHIHVYC